MSSNSTVNFIIGAVIGVATAGIGWAIGFSYYATAGMLAFGLSSSLLNRAYATPTAPQQKPQDFSNAGRSYSGRQAASQQIEINSATESIAIPVAFGTVRLGANHLRYDIATFRAVPIVERIQRSREAVAYGIARDLYRTDPAKVDREIDESARKKGGGKSGKGGKGGGRGGSPPPSQAYNDKEKINQYTTELLADDDTGTARLPKEYDERTIGFNYHLTFELGICIGPVSALHVIRTYPGEETVCDRTADPAILADDTELVGEGGRQGGAIRFYRGSATQTRNVADVYATDYSNYRHICFALFDDYMIGLQPTPSSYAFEVERMPECLDANGDVIEEMDVRAGVDNAASAVISATFAAGTITVNAAHGLAVGDTFFLDDFVPAAWDGAYVVASAPTADLVTAVLKTPPREAETFGIAQGPDTEPPVNISAASWAAGVISLTATNHGMVVDQTFAIAGTTPIAWNGEYVVKTTVDANHVTAEKASNPGAATVLGQVQPHPLPLNITGATWDDGVASFHTAGDHNLNPGDSVSITGMEPATWNDSFLVAEAISGNEFTAALILDPGGVTKLGTIKKRPDASYGDANPAAIIYEILTNKIWGLGMSPNLLDIPSFVACSNYFFDQRIGMSFALETQTDIGSVIEQIRSHVGIVLLWLGDKFYCRSMLDYEASYTPKFVLSAEQVKDANASRPSWSAAVNELRATFLDRFNNYQSAVVAATDDASIATIGRVNSRSVNLPGFSSRDTCERAVQRMLSEAAYPQAVLKLKMNRGQSNLFPTAFVEYRWDEWGDGTVTTFWRVSEITDSDTDSGQIEVTLVEDIYATARTGISEVFTVPVPAYVNMPRTSNEDLDFSDKPIDFDFGDIDVNMHETSIVLSDGDRIFAVFANRHDARLHYLQFFFRTAAAGRLIFHNIPAENETIVAGSRIYTWKASVSTTANEVKIGASEADCLNNLVTAITGGAGAGTVYGSDTTPHPDATAIVATEYSATATLTATSNPVAGTIVTIGNRAYRVVTALTPKEGEVVRGATTAITMANIRKAIMLAGTNGVEYSCSSAHTQVFACNPTTTTMKVTAREPGRGGNLIALAENTSPLVWSSTFMKWGSDRATNRTPGGENVLRLIARDKGPDGNTIAIGSTSNGATWMSPSMTGGSDYNQIGAVTPWAITGKLVQDLPVGLPITRDGVLEIQLDNANDRARFLEYCTLAQNNEDHLDKVTGAQINWLVMGKEFLQVAQAEAGSQFNRVRITAYIREQQGTEQEYHSAGERASFAYDYAPYDNSLRYDQIPLNEEVELRVLPTDRRGLPGEAFTILHTFTGEARKPLRVNVLSATLVSGTTYAVSYRPRWHNRGSGTFADLDQDFAARTAQVPTGYQTFIMPLDSSGRDLLGDPVLITNGTFTAELDDNASTGKIAFNYTAPAGTSGLVLYQAFNGVLGLPTTMDL